MANCKFLLVLSNFQDNFIEENNNCIYEVNSSPEVSCLQEIQQKVDQEVVVVVVLVQD